MSITRLKPNKLYLIQQIAGIPDDALLTNVLAAMQASYQGNLNTTCPTCAGVGFLSAGGLTKFPCYTCKGYLLIHTNGGEITPPVNVFEGTPSIMISNCLPCDILEAINEFSGGILPTPTLANTIISLQNGKGLDFNCSRCGATGNVSQGEVEIICPTCMGMQKTVRKYQTVDGVTSLADVSIAPPDPLPVPTNPFSR